MRAGTIPSDGARICVPHAPPASRLEVVAQCRVSHRPSGAARRPQIMRQVGNSGADRRTTDGSWPEPAPKCSHRPLSSHPRADGRYAAAVGTPTTTRRRARTACPCPWSSARPAPCGTTLPASAGGRKGCLPISSAAPAGRRASGPQRAHHGASPGNGGLRPAPGPSSGKAARERTGNRSCACLLSPWSSSCPGLRRCTRPHPAPRCATQCTTRCPGSASMPRGRPRCPHAASRRCWAATLPPSSTSTWRERLPPTAPPCPPF